MIRLMKDNIERNAHDEVSALKWERKGFQRMGTNAGNDPPPGRERLGDMTVEELKALAKDRKIAGYSALNKDDLLAILEGDEHDGTGKAENLDK